MFRPSTTPSVHAKRPDEEKAEGETQEESPIEIVEEDLSDDAILSRYGLSGTTVPATALISTTPESSVAAVDTAVLIGPPQPQQTVEVGNGIEAIEVTDIVESMFDDTRLIHQLAQSDIDAIDICKSYAFEPSQVNWHVADTHRWMQIYTLMNQDRDYFKRNGLSSTIAFDFLGIANYKCAIGTSHLCTVDCPTVVRGIEDLTTARHVFFVLTSSSHMLTVTELIHNAMEASQSNLHAMVGKMSLDYFFTTPTKGEVERGKAWQFFIQLTIWAVQTAITSIIPMIPWRLAQDCVVKAIRRVFFHNYGKDVLTIDGLEDNTEARALIADTMTEMMVSVGKDPGGLLVPPKYHRAMASDWSDIESKVGQRWLNAMKQKNAKPKTWLGTFVKNCETGGFGRAMGKVWSGMRDATWGALERVAGKWWWFRDGAESVEIESDADSTLDDLDSLDSHDSHDSHHSGKSHKTHKNGKDGGYFDGAVRPQATGSAGGRDGSVNWNDWEGKVKEWGGSMSDAAGPRSHWEDTSEGSRRMASSDLGFDGHRSGGSGYGGPIPGRFENSVSSGAGLTNNGGRGNSGARGSGGGSNVGLKSPVSGSASGRQSKSGSKSGGRNSGGSNAGGRNSGGSGSGGTNSGGLAAGMGNSVQSSLKGSNAGSSIGGGSKIGGGGSNSRGSKSGSKSGNSGSGSSNAAVMGSGSGRPLSDFLSNIQNEAHITWGDGIDPAPITPYDSVSNLGSPMRQSSRTQTSHKPYHKNNPKLVSLGPMEEWKDRDQWKKSKDVGFSTEEMLIDIWTRGVDFSHTIPKPKGFDSISKKIDYASKAASMLLPIAINLAMPMYLRDLFDAFTWTGTDMGSEYNNAHMKWIVQESGRYARRMLKENVNRLYSSSDVTIDGKNSGAE